MSSTPVAGGDAPQPWWLRVHRGLMPDYNRKAAAYWWAMVLLGLGVVAFALDTLRALPMRELAGVVAVAATAVVVGFFPVRIPRSSHSFAVGEIFIFLLLLLHGPSAATLAAAAEGFIAACRTSRRWTSRIASPAMGSVAMFASGSLFEFGIGSLNAMGVQGAGWMLVGSVVCAVFDFFLNTALITTVPHLKRNELPTFRELFGSFGWVGVGFAGSASVACLLFLAYQQSGIGVLLAAGPIIGMMLVALHYFFRQQEVDEAARRKLLEATERETVMVARHLKELEASERRFHSAFTHASIGMALVSFEGHLLQANGALCDLLGVDDVQTVQRRRFGEWVDAADAPAFAARLEQLRSKQVVSCFVELRLNPGDGSVVWAAVHGSLFTELDAAAPCLILQVQDITARRHAEAELHHIAFHDSLTGLPNRRRFLDLLDQAFRQGTGERPRHFALMFLDFDRFKLINDTLGHAIGDEFLVAVARRIQMHLRSTDVVARLGGDEFAILSGDLDSVRYAVNLAERLLEALRVPFQIDGNPINTSASFGITFSAGYSAPVEMLRDADLAMYKAKSNGKARYALFDAELHTEVSYRMRLERDLQRALARGELALVYQPMYELASEALVGFEALVRWNHPELGTVSPVDFVPVAEEAGLIVPLTNFVMRAACAQLGAWQQLDGRFSALKMHVNVSASDIVHPRLVERVNAALVEGGLRPQSLTLELTEDIMMTRLDAALPMLNELCRTGVGLSLDDFGTGHSSLRHLASLPVGSLKIDRSFVSSMARSPADAAVVQSIVLLGKSLGKAIVAEGIETAAQAGQLRQLGCAGGQGFHLSRPLAAEVVTAMLNAKLAIRRPTSAVPCTGQASVLH